MPTIRNHARKNKRILQKSPVAMVKINRGPTGASVYSLDPPLPSIQHIVPVNHSSCDHGHLHRSALVYLPM
jgi:hypothetical protein